ncbi:M10 family metallopeptidase C-terminal domain-containing protein [Gemmobacter denitrificans]|uniref:M10 family metallopeptidase C-terminal domain-containing protein n=1 Tax=Gemmobacter denitrificans TaxID=3123040 RepID=A0ABU8BX43_9RHOB
MPGPSLGTNLHGLVDWTTAFPFLDMFRLSRPWYTQSDSAFDTGHAALLDLDEAGWVRGFTRDGSAAPFDRVSTILFTGGEVPEGIYVLDWQGAGTVDLGFLPADAILSRDDHRITFRLEAGPIQISISATDPQGTGDHIRDIRLYNAQDRELIDSGAQFAPEFLDKIAGFRVLRFMDWMNTNNSPPGEWDETRPEDAARETNFGADSRGASVMTMVDLANEARADAWFTLPHDATDDYIRAFATYVRDNLGDGLVARFELSNEVWNWLFPQAHHAQAEAERLWGSDVEGGWMQWYGMRAAQMARIVAEVFGDETGTRALNVFATQGGWQGLETYALDAPELVAAGGEAPRTAPFHIYAIAPYFAGSIGSEEMATQVDAWAAQGEAGFEAALDWIRSGDGFDGLAQIGGIIAYHSGVAEDLGWQLEAYEGGQHVVDHTQFSGGAENPERTQFFTELVRHPGFEALYEEYFALWREEGGGLMAHFSDFGVGGRYGSWGIWNSSHAEDSPRARAVLEFRDGVEAWWADARAIDTFLNGRTLVDRDQADRMTGTQMADRLSALGGDNQVSGRGGDDWIAARQGADSLSGGAGHDHILAGGGADTLAGNGGRDALFGGGGADMLTGGLGADLLTGGKGADRFVFASLRESHALHADTITDFRRGIDRIDLSAFDIADAEWRGIDGLTGGGHAELAIQRNVDGPLRLLVDVDGNGRADLVVLLTGRHGLTLDDLIL